MKKLVLTLLILAAVSPCFAKYSGGSGEPNDPYQIANAADLLALAADTGDYDKHFILTADVDLDPNLSGNPVFTTAVIAPDLDSANSYFDGIPFVGLFDGAGHKISNLTINTNGIRSDYLGLFGCIGGFTGRVGEVKNLGLQNVSITAGPASERVAALVGENDAGIITNCLSTGIIGGGHDAIDIGGLIGMNLAGNISYCRSSCAVFGEDNAALHGGLVGDSYEGHIGDSSATGIVSGAHNCCYLGGLIGYITFCNITDCYATGDITGTDSAYSFGGLAGACFESDITNCFSTGDITGGQESLYLGGLVGEHASHSIINSCYAAGDVFGGEGSGSLGGLAGYNSTDCANCYSTGDITAGASSWAVGGLVGSNDAGPDESGNINKCYSRGIVRCDAFAGGLVGQKYAGTISNCYFLDIAGPHNGYGTPLADYQMKQASNFVGWDFVGETANGYNDFWRLCNEGLEYPKLAWQYLPGDIVCPDGVDILDLAILCEQWLLEKIPADVAPPGGDGIVNFADFAVFADQWGVTNDIYTLLDFTEQWLKVGLPSHSADIAPLPSGDGIVNFADFAAMANHWLEGF